MQSYQILWKIMKCIYVTLICIRKCKDRFPELSVVPDWKASSSWFCFSSSLLISQRSVEITGSSVLSSEVLVLEYWNSQQDIWLLWSILLQLLNRHSWAGCGLKIRMLIPRFFCGKAHPGSSGELGPLTSSIWKHERSLQGQTLCEVLFCGGVFSLCCAVCFGRLLQNPQPECYFLLKNSRSLIYQF